jgi:pimeloyl-ACP methyl ester carboxylesterase
VSKLLTRAAYLGIALVVATAAAQSKPDAEDRGPLKHAAVSGTKLAYVEAGQGETIVFVHGAFSDYRYWAPQLAEGAGNFHVLAYSRRDFYPNSHDSDVALQTPDRDAADLIELIESFDIAPVHLVGHSAGGHAALVAASRRPDLVRSLVLEEGGFVSDHPTSAQAQADIRSVIERSMEYRAAGAREAAARHFIDFVSGAGFFDAAAPNIRHWMVDNEPAFGLRPNAPLTCKDTSSVELPVLVVLGERSPPFIARQLSGLLACLRNERAVTIPHASHGIHYEQPEAFNRAVFEFIGNH